MHTDRGRGVSVWRQRSVYLAGHAKCDLDPGAARPIMDLLESFRHHLASLSLPAGRALVAVSGGPDSVALLDLLARARDAHHHDLVVAHFDHGIHPESSAVCEGVRGLAGRLGVGFTSARGHLGSAASETVARVARYEFLEAARRQCGAAVVFLGHHADDQAETVLMRVLCGSGPAGLAAMDEVSGPFVRPLLQYTRAQLAEYVRERSLPVWFDPANDDPRHRRSWIRRHLLPQIRTALPLVDADLLSTARQARRDRQAWDGLLDALGDLDVLSEPEGISVAALPLRGYDSALRHTMLLSLARRARCPLGSSHIDQVVRLLERGTSGDRLSLPGMWMAELSFGRLRLVKAPSARGPAEGWAIRGGLGSEAWGALRFSWARDTAPERQARAAMTAWFSTGALAVRGWRAGERVRPLAGRGRRLVVRCFQEAKVPSSRRPRWPVVADGAEIVWIPGICRADALLPSPGAEALRVDASFA